jgi:hypothetical protein
MPNYRCFVRGDNYPGQVFDRDAVVGFYGYIYVRALSSRKAEFCAMDKIRPLFADFDDQCAELGSAVTFEEIVQCEMIPRNRKITFHTMPMDEPNNAFMRAYNRSSHQRLFSRRERPVT